MNAVLDPKPYYLGRYVVSLGEGEDMSMQLGELRSDVRHIQSDATDIKAGVRDTNHALVSLREKLEQNSGELNKRIDATNTALMARFDDARAELGVKIEGQTLRMDTERRELTARMDSVRNELGDKVDKLAIVVDTGRKETVALIKEARDELGGRIEVTEKRLTAQISGLDAKTDAIRHELTAKIEGVEQKLTVKIDGVEQKLIVKIDGVEQKLTAKIDGVDLKLTAKIDGVRDSLISAKFWAIWLYIALAASLLLVMARGFKWI